MRPIDFIPLAAVIDSAVESAKQLGIISDNHFVLETRKLLRCGPKKTTQQDYHKDFTRSCVQRSPIPLKSLIVAIQDDTRLCVRGKEDVLLERGDFVIFGSRLEHAGSGYKKVHFRLFAYLGPQDFEVGNMTDYGSDFLISDSELTVTDSDLEDMNISE